MIAAISTGLVGLLLCYLGYRNMQGDISSLHSYHRSRVKDEDVKPFGKLVGIGTIICGASVIVFSALTAVAIKTEIDLFTIIGTPLLILGLVVGMAVTFYAMKKYNGGIF